jgi:hypothetical protein
MNNLSNATISKLSTYVHEGGIDSIVVVLLFQFYIFLYVYVYKGNYLGIGGGCKLASSLGFYSKSQIILRQSIPLLLELKFSSEAPSQLSNLSLKITTQQEQQLHLFSEEQKQVKKKKTRGQILFLFFCRICHF